MMFLPLQHLDRLILAPSSSAWMVLLESNPSCIHQSICYHSRYLSSLEWKCLGPRSSSLVFLLCRMPWPHRMESAWLGWYVCFQPKGRSCCLRRVPCTEEFQSYNHKACSLCRHNMSVLFWRCMSISGHWSITWSVTSGQTFSKWHQSMRELSQCLPRWLVLARFL